MILEIFGSFIFTRHNTELSAPKNTELSAPKKKKVTFFETVNITLIPTKEEFKANDLWWTQDEIREMSKMKSIAYEQFKKDYFIVINNTEDRRLARAQFYDPKLPDAVLGEGIPTFKEFPVSLAHWFFKFFV